MDSRRTPSGSAEGHTEPSSASQAPGSWWTSERYGLVGAVLVVLGLLLTLDGVVPLVGPALLFAGATSVLVAAVATGVRLGIREDRERR